MRLLLAAAIAAAAAMPAAGHEFWLQPSTFATADGEAVKVAILVGDAADVTPWKFKWEKVHSFRSYSPSGLFDQQTTIVPDTADTPVSAVVTFAGEGTHMLVLESYHQPIKLPADKFNAYIEEDGLTAAIEQRARTRTTRKPGREVYSRRTKALVQVGATVTDNVLQPIGQTLEIVPERNPYAPGTETHMPVRVLFQGRPLAGALVVLTALGTGSKPIERHVTGADGRAAFDVARRGPWMVSTVWTRPMEKTKLADYDTIFASLTFGYPGEHSSRPLR